MLKRLVLICLLLLVGSLLFAGDIASFVNLGFSDNSKYFMFGQYGVFEESSLPYTEIFTVDVKTNQFVPNGVKSAQFEVPVQPGQLGTGAFYILLEKTFPLTQKYGINHLKTGRILYILLNGVEPKPILQFRDFNTGNSYTVTLVQTSFGSGENTASSFHINCAIVNSAGKTDNYVIGLPDFK
ncbi:MAG: DUF2259 domain-containing protein, partial [Spirochaetota bacterium]